MDFQFDYWPKMVENSESLIAHSGVFDHINHGVFRNNGDIQRLKDHSILIAQDLARLKGMIDANPEYLLILSSDHGIDAQTAAGYGNVMICSEFSLLTLSKYFMDSRTMGTKAI